MALASPASLAIPDDRVAFLESGVSLLVGTRGADLRPTALRATGLRVHADRRGLDLLLPTAVARRTLDDLRESPRIALTASRPIDHVTLQLKGSVRAIREGAPADRSVAEAWLRGFTSHVDVLGLPAAITAGVAIWPAHVVEIVVDELFEQTPGPRAGHALAVKST